MEKKLCCFCLQVSFNIDFSVEHPGEWLCPACGKDISMLPSIPADQELSSEYVQEIVHRKGEIYHDMPVFGLKK